MKLIILAVLKLFAHYNTIFRRPLHRWCKLLLYIYGRSRQKSFFFPYANHDVTSLQLENVNT